jgi:hypothetical protein
MKQNTQRMLIPVLLVSFLILPQSQGTGAEPLSSSIEFNRDIRPILSKNCYACHGPDAKSRATKMRLDQRESAIAKNKKGTSPIVPGKPNESELIRRVSSHDETEQMPPKETGNQLTKEQIATLSRWIAEGASYA